MLRAVKDANELARLEAAGAAADATYEQILDVRFAAGRRPTSRPISHGCCGSTGTSRSTSRGRLGPNGANPHHEAGDRTIEVGDAIVLGLRRTDVRLRLGHQPDRVRG
jgi:D-alanyl-D-alanine dipeptidase